MKYLVLIIILFLTIDIYSQCPVKASAYPRKSIFCGDSVFLSALNSVRQPLNANFNKGKVDSLILSGSGSMVIGEKDTLYSCWGDSPEGSHFLLISTSSDTPRYIQTLPLDLYSDDVVGGSICLDLIYGEQKGLGSDKDQCEGIERMDEGVYLEYYTKDTKWVTINYWNPNPLGGVLTGGHDSLLINWNKYCFDIPKEALTTSTRFRLIQKMSDGVGYDAWAVDDISIILDVEGYKYDWTHDGLPPSITSETTVVTPTTDTTYTVFYSNGKNTCNDEIKINVLPPLDLKKASAECLASHLYIPNSFTPNGDGLNDIFLPITFNVIEYELQIYNRYGISIFKTNNYEEGWNGKVQGKDEIQQQDVYLYTIRIMNFDKREHHYIGKILIIK